MKSKIAIVSILLGVAFTFTQCVEKTAVQEVEFNPQVVVDPHDDGTGGSTQAVTEGVDGGSITGEFSETGATEVARSVTSVGVKNFEQIYLSMSVVSGINPKDENQISNTYNDLSTQLPNENDVKQFGSSTQFAIFKLGSEFCDVMLENQNYYNSVFTSLNVASSPNTVLSNDTQKSRLVDDLINRFWGAGVQDNLMVSQTKADLLTLMDDLLQGENLGSGTTTRKVAKGLCASLIITPPITMI